MALGGGSRRRGRCRRTWAGSRYAQAPATRARRAGGWPAGVLEPCGRVSALASAEGMRPTHGMRGLGWSQRERSPRAATGGPAPVHGPPRRAWRAAPPGDTRPAGTGSWRAGARRWRRSAGAVTARPAACQTLGGAGVGQPPAARHRRGAGPPRARPGERRSCRRPTALRRHVAALRSRRASSRARVRSRRASSSTVGPSPGVRSPARSRRARWSASRRAVCTRAPALVGSSAGATPQQRWPCGVSSRSSQAPHGPAAETKTRCGACACRVRTR